MLYLVRVAGNLMPPGGLAPNSASQQGRFAFGAANEAGVLVTTAGGRATKRINPYAFRKLVNHRVMVKHIPVNRLCHGRTATKPVAFQRRGVAKHPTGAVQVMHQ